MYICCVGGVPIKALEKLRRKREAVLREYTHTRLFKMTKRSSSHNKKYCFRSSGRRYMKA